MTLPEAKAELEKFVKLKTTLRPAFVDVLLNADLVEVRHGRWEETTTLDLWECSVCGHMIYSETVLDRKTFHKWCGKCGAKMDEVTEE